MKRDYGIRDEGVERKLLDTWPVRPLWEAGISVTLPGWEM
jgi:hypothetical protein